MTSSAQRTSSGEKFSMRSSSFARPSLSSGTAGRMSMCPFERDVHQSQGERGIVHSSGRCAPGETRVRMQVTVGIDVNFPQLTIVTETEVHPPIILTSERVEGGERRGHHPTVQLPRKGAGNRGAVDALG